MMIIMMMMMLMTKQNKKRPRYLWQPVLSSSTYFVHTKARTQPFGFCGWVVAGIMGLETTRRAPDSAISEIRCKVDRGEQPPGHACMDGGLGR